MTPNEIYRTAHKYIPKEQWKSTLFLRPDRDPNEMCISCKNEQTDVVRDAATLSGFQEFYGDRVKSFKVISCHCCGAMFSVFHPKDKEPHAQ